MKAEAHIHVVPSPDAREWRLSVSHQGTHAQIHIYGRISRSGTAHERLAREARKLADALLAVANDPGSVHWTSPRIRPKRKLRKEARVLS